MSQSTNEPSNNADGPHFVVPEENPEFAAWTEVEAGRFMPRRIRGSLQGRALG
jgi:hypothetical protein